MDLGFHKNLRKAQQKKLSTASKQPTEQSESTRDGEAIPPKVGRPILSFEEDETFNLSDTKKKVKNERHNFVFSKKPIIQQSQTINIPDADFSIKIKPFEIPKKDSPTSDSISLSYTRLEPPEEPPPRSINIRTDTIPDAATVYALKKQRERNRLKADIISIDGREISDEYINVRPSSGSSSDNDLTSIKAEFDEESERSNDSPDDYDNELREWEEQQMAKGTRASRANPSFGPDIPHLFKPQNVTRAPINYKKSVPWTDFEAIKNKIINKIADLEKNAFNYKNSLNDVDERIKVTETDINNVESQFVCMKQGYEFYQNMNGYVGDFILCFDEKITGIKEMEELLIFHMKTTLDTHYEKYKRKVAQMDSLINSDSDSLTSEILPRDFDDLLEDKADEKYPLVLSK
ncbi:GC-rich sequence DNA-binding factor 2 [Thelohanellus kitauei]|uniref:GC-rich sequence DNA-binding factor 2 n=1 Tax=Thelohanellus kitauei TaxID=669202 RepID=A0A0C2NAX5_THEKT|nr:GC-rich sequence DNA-binding factor 2 [Thelohanellus kitauei]